MEKKTIDIEMLKKDGSEIERLKKKAHKLSDLGADLLVNINEQIINRFLKEKS